MFKLTQAPGPIVRPRSERKRGRPRKNPLNDQDLRNSGIFLLIKTLMLVKMEFHLPTKLIIII
jgi:hypothetical protein